MGEYAKDNRTGETVKIGTCEDMYYLRPDQIDAVSYDNGYLLNSDSLGNVRLRFPFPNEDQTLVGQFEDHEKAVFVDFPMDGNVEHGKTQFSDNRRGGYLICLPCPESKEGEAYRFTRNGHGGPVKLVQTKWNSRGKHYMPICACTGCGAKFRLENKQEAEPLIDALNAQGTDYSREIAKRVIEGFTPSLSAHYTEPDYKKEKTRLSKA